MLTDLECRSAYASTPSSKECPGHWHWLGPKNRTDALKLATRLGNPWPAYCVVTALSRVEDIARRPDGGKR